MNPPPAASDPSDPDVPELVFVSYSRKDEQWLNSLQAHLAPLEREGSICRWVDKGKIEYGDRYNDEIATAIDTCGAAILLVSPHFQNSTFIQDKELPRLLRRADAGELKLYWLQVSDCHLASKLGKTYHSANDSQQALEAMSAAQVNKVLANLTRDLEKHALSARTARHAAAHAEEERKAREAADEKKRAEREAAQRAQKERLEHEAAEKSRRAERIAEERAQKERRAREAAEMKQRDKEFKEDFAPVTPPRKNFWGRAGHFVALLALIFGLNQARKWMYRSQPSLPPVSESQLVDMAKTKILGESEERAKLLPLEGIAVSNSTYSSINPFTNSLGMKFVPIPGTTFLMSVWETRVKDYAAYAAANPGVDMEWKDVERSGHKQTDDHPVVNVSWEDATAFCKWLSAKEGKLYRLPTDHEWSIAVGIGDREDPKQSPEDKDIKLSDVYPWGNTWPPPKDTGNFDLDTDEFPFTAPVGSFTLNHHGIFDLSGNVYEWCQDKYSPSSSAFVLRGGSWFFINRYFLLSSDRFISGSTYRSDFIGFRCVLVGGEAR